MTKVFSIKRLVVFIGWAKSGTWTITTDKETRTYLISMHLVQREEKTVLSLIVGPVSLMLGIKNK